MSHSNEEGEGNGNGHEPVDPPLPPDGGSLFALNYQRVGVGTAGFAGAAWLIYHLLNCGCA